MKVSQRIRMGYLFCQKEGVMGVNRLESGGELSVYWRLVVGGELSDIHDRVRG